ncbi:DUF1360 domain-containing protein [Streptomyces flavidovirens]|uniref:DUF1360 domain-containing protein n=1 Tax=Streptomyces flavidovirens TaxID=67298 RepID=A0ABW6RLA0_9ACTN
MSTFQRLRPHTGHLAAMAVFGGYTAGWTVLVRRMGRSLPASVNPWDVLFTAAATFRLSRLVGKATVTRPIRAPFTHVESAGAPAELNETPSSERGRHTAGELISCPFCLSVWIVTTLTGAQLMWPRATKTASGALTALAAADALQLAYTALTQKAEH